MGYSFVTQLAPALLASFLPRNPLSAAGAMAGIVAGVATVTWMTLGNVTFAGLLPGLPGWVQDLNVGFAALVVNLAVAGVVSLVPANRRPVPSPSGLG
jgi:solute:Na+ symporter, SSS family